MSNGKVDFASEVAALKFRPGRFEVWKKTSLFKEPLLRNSVFIIAIYGLGNAIIQFLYKMNQLSLPMKDSIFPLLYLSPLIGGLYIVGGLNARRACLSMVFAFMYGLFIYAINKYFYNAHSLLEIFQIIPGCWLVVWWVATQPELMNKFGLRKSHFPMDLLFAIIPVVFVAVYVAYLFNVLGFKIEFKPVDAAAYFSGNVISCMFVSNYCFAVRNMLKKRGANTFQCILTLLILLGITTGPAILVYSILGLMKPLMALGGFFWTLMLTMTVMHFAFTKLKNSLAATFLIAMVMLLMKMAGIS